jgi:Ribonucleotide reductase inhibitor
MDRHTHKRQYQPSITSFFSSENFQSQQHSHVERPRHHHSHIDHQTQSTLLSLGMRIRKAVPEGYKTHKTLPSTPLYSYSSPQPRPAPVVRQRELAPLCGLFKVGGLVPPPDAFTNTHRDTEEPELTFESSQESNFSIQTEPDVRLEDALLFGGPVGSTSKNKRRHEHEDSDGDFEDFMPDWHMTSPGKAFPGRVFARPRRKFVQSSTPTTNFVGGMEQDLEFDFEEASFLQDWNDAEGEVEMIL